MSILKHTIPFAFLPRDPKEDNRATTPLELLFDLAAVVAIGMVARGLAHSFIEEQVALGLIRFLFSFFMIWWAWMNYVWFASAYYNHSGVFQLLTMVAMFGLLIVAAGVEMLFSGERIWLVLAGFIVLRLAMIFFWLGAAQGDPLRRRTGRRYAAGLFIMQLFWLVVVAVVPPGSILYLPLFLLGAAGELAVPALAEWKIGTPWHRGHIISRYARLNLIVLGQCFIAIVLAMKGSPGMIFPEWGMLGQALLFAIVGFSMWSFYFTHEEHLGSDDLRRALLWGYGHFAVFGAAAMAGAGMQVVLATDAYAATPVVLPIAVYCATLWLIRDRYCRIGMGRWTLLVTALVLAIVGSMPLAGFNLVAVALVLAGAVFIHQWYVPALSGPAH
ncbi:low temperature requirement protein A [Halomonas sp. SpR8]|uniref:low temperature requirement protein A n=1 Tax=Halomonas sp. SpR8 TaxID=3050463 RepID=UPI0027E51A06|nr:low temperature requirement protein A [Halomonas sp. SpR8]MDQ7728574.1 low temperature requirement protein A [Halomonas sp. SpR8]